MDPYDIHSTPQVGPDEPTASDSHAAQRSLGPGIMPKLNEPTERTDDLDNSDQVGRVTRGTVEPDGQSGTRDPEGTSDAGGENTGTHAPSRRPRRTWAQREAAAQDGRAALEAERRKLRTRGAILAGGLLVRVAKVQPALTSELAPAIRTMSERDREALRLFAPALGA